MNPYFSIDATSPTSYKIIGDYLYDILYPIIKNKMDIIFLCIGSDRCTGDSLGPLTGYKLKKVSTNNIYIIGSLDYTIHSKNLEEVLVKINNNYTNPFIIAIDSCLGNIHNIGKIFIENKPLRPGLALNKALPPIGNISIKGIVNISGNMDFIVLQNTRLYTVMTIADCIADGISYFISKAIKIDATKTK